MTKFKKFKKDYGGIIYVVPVLLGILLFTIIPMIVSAVYSLFDYNPMSMTEQLTNFGFQHYKKMFTTDWPSVSRSLFLTFRYAILTVSTSLVGSYCLALVLNQKRKGMGLFRVLYYLPCLIPAVAGSLLWKDITKVNSGYINLVLEKLGLPAYTFYEDPETVLATILITGIVGWGGNTIMWLAQMKNIPESLYEAAEIDGANYFHKLFKITIPMTTPMVFYLMITGIIGALQVFGSFYTLRNGICDNEIFFIVIKIYEAAFGGGGGFSYACALSWLLFAIIGIITLVIFKSGNKWVFYGEEM